jgi:hypothetical protein
MLAMRYGQLFVANLDLTPEEPPVLVEISVLTHEEVGCNVKVVVVFF